MKRWFERVSAAKLAAYVVALVFAVAAVGKLADPGRFAVEIGNYRLVPPEFAALLALYLPWLELVLALAMVSSRHRAAARVLSLGLLLGFCVALASALWRGLDIRCGCFGGGGGATAGEALLRNLVLISLLALSTRLERVASGADADAGGGESPKFIP